MMQHVKDSIALCQVSKYGAVDDVGLVCDVNRLLFSAWYSKFKLSLSFLSFKWRWEIDSGSVVCMDIPGL